METSFGSISQFKSFENISDSNNKIFDLLDEVSQTFSNHLEEVQGLNTEKEQVSIQERKEIQEEQRKPVSWEEQGFAQSYSF